MMRSLVIPTLLVLLLPVAVAPVLASGGTREDATRSAISEAVEEKTPEQEAIEHYNWGIAQRDNAWKLEKKLDAAGDAKSRAKLEKKIQKAYRGAQDEFERAVARNPAMFQAHSDLGYVLRKQGRYDDALRAYDRALELEPRYPEAIEYRGEAFLGLNRLDDAKQAYIELFGTQREYADKLLAAMSRWIAEQRESRSATPAVDELAGWVTERQEIAEQTKPVSRLRQHTW